MEVESNCTGTTVVSGYGEEQACYTDTCAVERNRWSGPIVMVLGGICFQQRTTIVIFDLRPGRGNGVKAQRYNFYRQCCSTCAACVEANGGHTQY